MGLRLRSLAGRLRNYILSVLQREAKIARLELQKYEESLTLAGAGIVCFLIGRSVNLSIVQVLGALAIAYALLKVIK